MAERTVVIAATNLLRRGFQVVSTDRQAPDGSPTGALYAVARAVAKALDNKPPRGAVAVLEARPPVGWPALLEAQRARLPELLRAFGLEVVEAPGELQVVATYTRGAERDGHDVLVVGVDKRLAQLVSDRVGWFDANKDVRYTVDAVRKRFTVAPERVAAWLALVGDEDELPGVKGIGAKSATGLVETHPTPAALLGALENVEGRVGKLLREAVGELPARFAQASLDAEGPLPRALDALAYTPPQGTALNATLAGLGFTELLVSAAAPQRSVAVVTTAAQAEESLRQLGAATVAIHVLYDEPGPGQSALVGVALAPGDGLPRYVPFGSEAWARLVPWLEDAAAPKSGHDLVGARVALRRAGVHLAGVVADSECQSHLTQPSNWAPHELPQVARQVSGLALQTDEELLGAGKSTRRWADLAAEDAASVAGQRARASADISRALAPGVETKQLAEYLALQPVLVDMELLGLRVDLTELDRAEADFVALEASLETDITRLAGHAFNINSSKQLGQVLFEELKLPVALHTKTGWSTANEALERIEHAHPIVTLVMRFRALRRLRDSWVAVLRKAVAADGRVHSRFHLARSFSGHLVNSNPDLGRVPGRTPEMERIRRAFIAPPGHVLMSVDFSQLGLFVLAHLTKDPALVEPLRSRADLHRLTAAAVLEKSAEQLSYDERQLGKVINFATFAGQGASALGLQLGITPAQAKEYVARFDRHYAQVRAFQDEQLRLAKVQGYVVTLAGRKWPIGGLESLDPMLRSYAERLARRATHEGSVCDVARRALLDVDVALRKEGLATRPLLQVLDEILFEVPEAELPRAAALCAQTMRQAFTLEVPLRVGVEVGPSWAQLRPFEPVA